MDEKTPPVLISDEFAKEMSTAASQVFQAMATQGFHRPGSVRTMAHYMGMVMTELAEAIEADRKGLGTQASEKIPGFTNLAEELADAIIRLMDTSVVYGIDIGAAIQAKMKYNAGRQYRHGREY